MNIKFILINIYILEGRVIKFGGASILLYRNVCSLNLTNVPYLCDNLYNNTVWGTLCLHKKKICASFAQENY